jgi:hypothetical protein
MHAGAALGDAVYACCRACISLSLIINPFDIIKTPNCSNEYAEACNIDRHLCITQGAITAFIVAVIAQNSQGAKGGDA